MNELCIDCCKSNDCINTDTGCISSPQNSDHVYGEEEENNDYFAYNDDEDDHAYYAYYSTIEEFINRLECDPYLKDQSVLYSHLIL